MLCLHILTFILFIHSSLSIPCSESDYQQYFTECDTTTNTRNITIYLTSNCTTPSTPSQLVQIYSTLPTFTIQCGMKCPGGTIIKYDPILNVTVCEKCPPNTYSTGGDIKINNEWNDQSLRLFQTNCYAIGLDGYTKNENCTGLLLHSDKTMIMSGELTGNQLKYFIQSIYFFKAKNKGKFILQYKKDSVKESSYNNGDFKLFFDYDYITGDNEPDTPWRTITHEFLPGEHEIVIFYWYFKTHHAKNKLKFYIKSFEVIGIDDTSYKCIPCVNSVSPEGSDRCNSCPSNYYYETSIQNCVACPQGQYSISSSSSLLNNADGCKPRKECSYYDYKISNVSECIDDEKLVTYSSLQPSFCLDESNVNKIVNMACDVTSYATNKYTLNNNSSNEYIDTCKGGYAGTSVFKLDLLAENILTFWNTNIGWKNNGDELYTGLYISEPTEMIINKAFTITYPLNAYVKVLFSVDLDNNEVFKIKTPQRTITYTDTKIQNEIQQLPLNEGDNNYIEFYYEKLSTTLKETNAVSIKYFEIYGSNLSHAMLYQKCPYGTISPQSNSCSSCIECDDNAIPNTNQTECILCDNGLSHINMNNEYICKECPSFTYLSDKKCKLNEVLHQHNEKLKYNLRPMKEWLNKLCSEQSGILCYENSFIGPISSSNVQSSSSSSHDIFFLSLFEPKDVDIYDFSYDESYTKYHQGHIFGLFSVQNIIDTSNNNTSTTTTTTNNNKLFDKDITFQNTKIKKNIATRISKVNLLSDKKGIVIEYKEGDVCLNDVTRKYKTYLYLKCNKYEISTPKLINVFDNKCSFIFEWASPFICKNCITSELNKLEVGACKNNIRKIKFNMNNDCLIFNASNAELIGYDKVYEDTLVQIEELNININGKRRNEETERVVVVQQNGENITFNFTYIENEVYYEECTFIDNIDHNWKKYLLVIPIAYLITVVLVICYCCKYKKVKNEYEKLRNHEGNNNESNSITKEKEQENKINFSNVEDNNNNNSNNKDNDKDK